MHIQLIEGERETMKLEPMGCDSSNFKPMLVRGHDCGRFVKKSPRLEARGEEGL